MVSAQKIYNAVNDYCKFSGLNSAYKYLLDPASEEAQAQKQAMEQGQQAQKEQEMQMTMAQLKMQADLAQAELGKAQAMQMNVQLKAEVEKAKQERELEKQRYDTKITLLESRMSQLNLIAEGDYKDKELEFKEKQLDQNTFIELAKLNVTASKPQPETKDAPATTAE
jgi:multidrug efflux pump subunit AcrA (membrane-fusion protein)